MNTLEIIFFILLSIVFYTYIGYGIILWILVRIKRIFIKEKSYHTMEELHSKQPVCKVISCKIAANWIIPKRSSK